MKIPTPYLNAAARRLALAASCAIFAAAARASVTIDNTNVQIGGFFSQGYLYSNNNNFPTADEGGTWDFREMAFNVSDTIGAHLRIGGQAFAQSFGNIGDDKIILYWANADYNFNSWFGLRAGRIKYPKGLYGEALDLDSVRPFIFLPGSVYNPILRDFSASFDGGMAYGSFNLGKSSFDYKVFFGDIPMNPNMGVAEFYDNSGFYSAAGGVQKLSISSVTGGQITWNTPIEGLKFMNSYSFFTNLASDGPFAAYPAISLQSNFDRFTYDTFSAEYTVRDWVFASEWQRSGGTISYSALPLLPTVSGNTGWDGWYVSAARRLNDKFEVGAYYGSLKDRFTSVPGSNPASHQDDTAVSFRYDINDHIIFKIEAHYIDGNYQTFDTVRIPNPPDKLKGDTTVLAVKTTFSF
jgi:hypothetical protein